jgi:hypothetical protein
MERPLLLTPRVLFSDASPWGIATCLDLPGSPSLHYVLKPNVLTTPGLRDQLAVRGCLSALSWAPLPALPRQAVF